MVFFALRIHTTPRRTLTHRQLPSRRVGRCLTHLTKRSISARSFSFAVLSSASPLFLVCFSIYPWTHAPIQPVCPLCHVGLLALHLLLTSCRTRCLADCIWPHVLRCPVSRFTQL